MPGTDSGEDKAGSGQTGQHPLTGPAITERPDLTQEETIRQEIITKSESERHDGSTAATSDKESGNIWQKLKLNPHANILI
jgi:hypothetical protein